MVFNVFGQQIGEGTEIPVGCEQWDPSEPSPYVCVKCTAHTVVRNNEWVCSRCVRVPVIEALDKESKSR